MKGGVNNTVTSRQMAPDHTLDQLAEKAPAGDIGYDSQIRVQADGQWSNVTTRARQAVLAHVDVYLDDFIAVTQGVPKGRR